MCPPCLLDLALYLSLFVLYIMCLHTSRIRMIIIHMQRIERRHNGIFLPNRHAIETFVKRTRDGIVRKTELPPKNDQHIQWKGHTIELFAKGTHNGIFCRRGAQWNTLYNGRAMESYEQGAMQERSFATDSDYLSS